MESNITIRVTTNAGEVAAELGRVAAAARVSAPRVSQVRREPDDQRQDWRRVLPERRTDGLLVRVDEHRPWYAVGVALLDPVERVAFCNTGVASAHVAHEGRDLGVSHALFAHHAFTLGGGPFRRKENTSPLLLVNVSHSNHSASSAFFRGIFFWSACPERLADHRISIGAAPLSALNVATSGW